MKNLLLSCALALLAPLAIAQPQLTWQHCYGNNGVEYIYDAKHTLDGGYILVGQANTNGGDVTGPMRGLNDAWIVKTDGNGAFQWSKVLGGTSLDYARTVCQTPDSGYLVLLYSNSQDYDMGVGSHGLRDIWIAKLTAAGSLSWIHSYGGGGTDDPAAIAPTSDGNYIVAGVTNSTNGDISVAKGTYDLWMFKISAATGNLIWERSYGGTGSESASGISATSDGGFILAGTHSSVFNGDVTVSHGQTDMWIIKTDSLGNLEWQKTVGGSGYDYGTAVVQTFDGGYAATGYGQSNDIDFSGNNGDMDLFIAKLSATGALQWTKTYGGTASDFGTCIKQTRDSNLLVLGKTTSNDGDVTGFHGDTDIWLVLADQNGNLESQRTLGGSQFEEQGGLDMVSDSVYIVSGRTYSTDGDASGGGYHPGSVASYTDGWLLKLKIPITLSVESLHAASATVKVFPTLTTNSVNVVFDMSTTKKRVMLVNSIGQIVADHRDIKSDRISIPFFELAAGTYILNVIAGEAVSSHKITYQP